MLHSEDIVNAITTASDTDDALGWHKYLAEPHLAAQACGCLPSPHYRIETGNHDGRKDSRKKPEMMT